MVFYNAMLPTLVPAARRGRVSGWGWGLGYVGGLACLLLALMGFAQAEAPWLDLDKERAEHLRATSVMVALWYAAFALPLFLFTPDRPATGLSLKAAARQGLRTLIETLRAARRHAAIVRFLLAHMLYTNGLTTLFAFGAIYAAGTFGMDFPEVVRFGIALNIAAGFGAFAFAWIDDWIGSKRTILLALAGLSLFGGVLVVVPSKPLLWVFGVALGIFVGPAQAAGRSLMARLAPSGRETEMFGLYALAGKATAFLGPLALAQVTEVFGNQRAGMATILVFLLSGMAILGGLRETDDGTPLR